MFALFPEVSGFTKHSGLLKSLNSNIFLCPGDILFQGGIRRAKLKFLWGYSVPGCLPSAAGRLHYPLKVAELTEIFFFLRWRRWCLFVELVFFLRKGGFILKNMALKSVYLALLGRVNFIMGAINSFFLKECECRNFASFFSLIVNLPNTLQVNLLRCIQLICNDVTLGLNSFIFSAYLLLEYILWVGPPSYWSIASKKLTHCLFYPQDTKYVDQLQTLSLQNFN